MTIRVYTFEMERYRICAEVSEKKPRGIGKMLRELLETGFRGPYMLVEIYRR